MNKPHIIALSPDDDQEFRWQSDGWYMGSQRHLPANQTLFDKACQCINEGNSIIEVIALLEAAGFRVTRSIGPS